MFTSAGGQIARVGRATVTAMRACSSEVVAPLHQHNSKTASRPLISQYRSRWPRPAKRAVAEDLKPIPRTVPGDKLRFQFRATFGHGSSILYPHLKFHPADYKVGLVVKVADCGFSSDLERNIFIEMVGKRYNTGKKEVRLTTDRFSNRIENKKYLTLLLERLIAESKKLAAAPLAD
jgi:hypothetical protein